MNRLGDWEREAIDAMVRRAAWDRSDGFAKMPPGTKVVYPDLPPLPPPALSLVRWDRNSAPLPNHRAPRNAPHYRWLQTSGVWLLATHQHFGLRQFPRVLFPFGCAKPKPESQ